MNLFTKLQTTRTATCLLAVLLCLLTGSVRAQESGNEITDQLTATSLDLGSSYANFTATSSTTGITFKGQGMANSTGAIQLEE